MADARNPFVPAPVPEHHDHPKMAEHICATLGLGVGVLAGIYGAIRLTMPDLFGIPGVSLLLAQESMVLGIYKGLAPFVVAGTATNYYANYGKALDVGICGVRTFPRNFSGEDIKDWFKSCTLKNSSHIVGVALGTGLTCVFVYHGAVNSAAKFVLPFNVTEGLPNALLMVNAFVYIPGFFSNNFSFLSLGFTESCKAGKSIAHGLKRLSFFNRPAIAENPPAAEPAAEAARPAAQV